MLIFYICEYFYFLLVFTYSIKKIKVYIEIKVGQEEALVVEQYLCGYRESYMLELGAIWVFPVKSMRGFSVSQWPVDARGLRYDRQWMLVDKRGNYVTMRQLPRMGVIRSAIRDEQLVLSHPEHGECALPLEAPQGDSIAVTIWRHETRGIGVGKEVDSWLEQVLGRPVRLVCMPDDEQRGVDPDYAEPQDRVGFADGFPFLVASSQSLRDFNRSMGRDMDMERFRANLVVDGGQAWQEDHWRRIQVGDIPFRTTKPCSRCSLPNVDLLSAERQDEPLKTLERVRRSGKNTYFGVNSLHDCQGLLSVGDAVKVLESGEARPELDV